MQVFIPYIVPFSTAQVLDKKRLNKQIIECNQIQNAIEGKTKAWANHPATLMYKSGLLYEYLIRYTFCLECYKDNNIDEAKMWSHEAMLFFCQLSNIEVQIMYKIAEQHKRRLYTKDSIFYSQFSKYGISEENWYFVNGKVVKYINGKKQKA